MSKFHSEVLLLFDHDTINSREISVWLEIPKCSYIILIQHDGCDLYYPFYYHRFHILYYTLPADPFRGSSR